VTFLLAVSRFAPGACSCSSPGAGCDGLQWRWERRGHPSRTCSSSPSTRRGPITWGPRPAASSHAGADGLAKRGVLFEQCIAAAPITLSSHATILTGLYPYHHGARNNGTHHLPAEVPTLAETLQRAGFETGAVVSAIVLDSRFGLDRGFATYDDDLSSATSKEEFVYRQVDAADTSARAIRWLEGRGDERWFLWVHFFDPHADYAPPARFRELCQGSAYDGEIAYATRSSDGSWSFSARTAGWRKRSSP
jgi:arylsulfatase A-like enzyme